MPSSGTASIFTLLTRRAISRALLVLPAGRKKQPDLRPMPVQSLNLLVFRDGKRLASGKSLKTVLGRHIQSLCDPPQPVGALAALLLAGELESALADCGPDSHKFGAITDSLADALVRSSAIHDANSLLAILDATHVPETLSLSVPEGFAYYALHPLAFAD